MNFFVDDFERRRLPPPDFFISEKPSIGPCCWLEKKKWELNRSLPSLPEVRPADDFFQGAIYLYEYNLTIGNTPCGNMDVFSYGKSAGCPNPILHAVFEDCDLLGVRPKEIIMDDGDVFSLNVSDFLPEKVRKLLPTPLSLPVMKIRVSIIDAQPGSILPEKGTKPTKIMAERSRYVQPLRSDNKDVEGVLILGRVPSCDE